MRMESYFINWYYVSEDGQPTETDKSYLVAVIADRELVECGCPKTFTTYAYYNKDTDCWSDDNGYELAVYAWTNSIEAPDKLDDKDWRQFFINEKETWDAMRLLIKKNKWDFVWHTWEDGYAMVEILCTPVEEDKIDEFIDMLE